VSEIIDALQERLSYIFKDRSLIVQALTHRSYSIQNNERLEFLGDAILDFLVGEFLYRQYPSATEGELSNMRSQIVCGEQLTMLGRELMLGESLLLGAGEEKSGGRERGSSLANAVESVVAAVYLDGGIECCRQLVETLFSPMLGRISLDAIKDSKTRLQEYLQSRHLPLPKYILFERTGSEHNLLFTMRCEVESFQIQASATASSRKKAEQLAAEQIIRQLEL
jgi:ribonuclease-3